MARNIANDQGAQVALLVVVLTAVVLPLTSAYVWKLWRRLRAISPPEEDSYPGSRGGGGDGDQEFKDYIGRFNSDIIKGLKPVEVEGGGEEGEVVKNAEPKIDEGMVELEGEEAGEDTTTTGFSKTSLATESIRIADLLGTCTSLKGKIPKRGELSNTPSETDELLKSISENGLHGKLATAQLHSRTQKIEQSMTDKERQEEREIRNQQLNSIFQLMQAQGEKFGVSNKDDLMDQMKLYSV